MIMKDPLVYVEFHFIITAVYHPVVVIVKLAIIHLLLACYMIEYDMVVICQSTLSFKIIYFLLDVYSIVMSVVSLTLLVSNYLYDVFSRCDDIYS